MFSAARLRPAANTGVSSDTAEKRRKLSAECAGTHSRERPCARNRQSLSRWGVDRMELLLFPLPLPGGFRKLQRLAKRKARKEKQQPSDNHPRFAVHRCLRGKIICYHNCPAHPAEDCRNGAAAFEKDPVPFLLDRPRPVFFFKKKMGGGTFQGDHPGPGTP